MTFIEVLFSSSIIVASIAYLIAATILMFITIQIHNFIEQRTADHWLEKAFSNWYMEHIWLPLIKVFSILIFVLIAYPILFGLSSAPDIWQLLITEHRLSTLINFLFLSSLLLPFIPLIGNLHAIVLPLQGCLAAGLLFKWSIATGEVEPISYWPDFFELCQLVVIALASHWTASFTSQYLGDWLDKILNRHGFEDLVLQITLLLFQAPIIIIYSLSLGKQAI